jgi:hypothetical protein
MQRRHPVDLGCIDVRAFFEKRLKAGFIPAFGQIRYPGVKAGAKQTSRR